MGAAGGFSSGRALKRSTGGSPMGGSKQGAGSAGSSPFVLSRTTAGLDVCKAPCQPSGRSRVTLAHLLYVAAGISDHYCGGGL